MKLKILEKNTGSPDSLQLLEMTYTYYNKKPPNQGRFFIG